MRVGLKNIGQFIGCNDSSIRVSKHIWSENITVQFIFENIFIFCLGSNFWRKKSKSYESVPEKAGEDRGVALLWRQHACLGIGVCVREVRIASNSVSKCESTISPVPASQEKLVSKNGDNKR
jgi:hypothetical protein